MPRGRPKGSKNKPKNDGDLTNLEDIEVKEEYQLVSGRPPISNWNPFEQAYTARIYGTLNHEASEIIEADGSVSYKGAIPMTKDKNGIPYRRLNDGRCFNMSGWPMADPDAKKTRTRKTTTTKKAPAKKTTTRRSAKKKEA